MARRKRGENPNHERWLVSYADFITLLFAFFVVLYSTAQGDQKKAALLAAAIQDAFQQLGVFSATASTAPSVSSGTTQAVPKTPPNQLLLNKLSEDRGVDPVADVEQLRRELERQLAKEIDRNEVSLHMDADGLVISLREVGFFDSGSPKLKQRSQIAFAKVAHVLAERENLIRIEGHTDNVPIHTSAFASNWELSTARATEVIRKLLVEYKLEPKRLSAAGYGEYHPVASNGTEAGRQVNRRVDIVVLYGRPSSRTPERPRTRVTKLAYESQTSR